MERYWVILFIALVIFIPGCAGHNKISRPISAIDRLAVDPKGTWSAAPSVGVYSVTSDTIAYRGLAYYNMFVPTVSYSLTDNLLISAFNFFSPILEWQLTKSPYADSSERYKWQIALSAETFFGLQNYSGNVSLDWKKRLSYSVWYSGGVLVGWEKDSGKRIYVTGGNILNGIGFQLSPKASIMTRIFLDYEGYYNFLTINNVGYSGYFNFEYDFSPWFSLNYYSGIYGYRKETGIESGIGAKFFW